MAAIDMPKYTMPPIHRFEQRQMMRKNKEGDMDLAYVLVPQLDGEGRQMFEEQVFPDGRVLKKALLIEDVTKPITMDIMILRPHSGKDEFEYDAMAFIKQCEQQSRMAEPLYVPEWAAIFRQNYENWKTGREPIMDGTSVLNWPGITRAMAEHLIKVGFPTIEQIAAANEQAIMQIGTGGRALKYRAAEYMERNKVQVVKDIQTELVAQKVKADEQAEMIETQGKQIAQLLAALQSKVGNLDAAPSIGNVLAEVEGQGTLHLPKKAKFG